MVRAGALARERERARLRYDLGTQLLSTVDELATAEPGAHQEEEVGDLFFALVNLARKMGISSEEALERANEKFVRRFAFMEAACRAAGCRPEEMTLEELDALWNEAKADERRGASGG